MAEFSTTASEDKEVAVISDSEEDADNIVENFDGLPQPHSTLPPEVWAMVIDCEYCILPYCNISPLMFIGIILIPPVHPLPL